MSRSIVQSILVAGALSLSVATARNVRAQTPDLIAAPSRFTTTATALTAFIEHEMRVHGIPALSIALVDSTGVVWSRGFGVENRATQRPATANTVYRVGSVSKLFTDLGVMQLVEQGTINLDAPVQRYLRSFQPINRFRRTITLRQLMSHYSGLVREPPVGHYFDNTSPTLAATVASLNQTAIVHAPGTHFKYSNAGIAVVGAVLEQQSKAAFAEYLQRNVLDRLGMSSSSFTARADLVSRVPQAQMWTTFGRTFDAPTFSLGMAPAGSMYSTMPDLGRFISMLFNGGKGARDRVLSAESLDAMWQPQFAPVSSKKGAGLGFQVSELDGVRMVAHNGAIYGFATQLSALPSEKLGVAVSASKDGVNALTERIALSALRLMRAAQASQPLPLLTSTRSVSLKSAREIAGTYQRDTQRVEIVTFDSTVRVSGTVRALEYQLRQWHGDTLIADDGIAFGPKVWRRGDTLMLDGKRFFRQVNRAPQPAQASGWWNDFIGGYGWDYNTMFVFERDGVLQAQIEWFFTYPLTRLNDSVFTLPKRGLYANERVVFSRGSSGRARVATVAGILFDRLPILGEAGDFFRITPERPVAELLSNALAASPPNEPGEFRAPALTELVTLDSTIKLDVRYASDRNFMSTPFYSQARAFLQRPAAEALVRVHQSLAGLGYGLLIHDGYRPWYVTKMFWDGTAPSMRNFVADPSRGSRHNRGCAVDLTLFDLRTGLAVVSTGLYDEMSDRSYAAFPGGTSQQRALRDLLRIAMEAEGFSVYADEWWHFDYKDWPNYRISNLRFEDLGK